MKCKQAVMVLSFTLVLVLLVCAVKPALAEAPPPPGEGQGSPAQPAPEQPSVLGEEARAESEPEVALDAERAPDPAPAAAVMPLAVEEWASPPMIAAGGVGQATIARFVSDEQMLDSGGVLRGQGETLAALFAAGAIACPAGKTPQIYGGVSNTGCTPYIEQNGGNNPIQLANDHTLTKSGWWIWVSPGYNSSLNSTLDKAVVVKGDPAGTSVTGGLELSYPNITLRDVVVKNGQISARMIGGTLRMHGVTVSGSFPGQYGIYIRDYKGSLYLTHVSVSNTGGMGAFLEVEDGLGTVTVLNSAFNRNTGGIGLNIHASNAVRLENVSAAVNGHGAAYGSGMLLYYRNRLTLKNICVIDNVDAGIVASDSHPSYAGPVTLQNITANGSYQLGGITLLDPGPVSGARLTANGNHTNGIVIADARGSVALSGVTAVDNDMYGMSITSKTGSISLVDLQIAHNDVLGVLIQSKGSVWARNALLYDNNKGSGIDIDNSDAAVPAGVTLTNINTAENAAYGIQIHSKGPVSLSGISARDNDLAGTRVRTNGGVTVGSTYGANAFIHNGIGLLCPTTPSDMCDGLMIQADGAVLVSGVGANQNGWDGILIAGASSARVSNTIANDNTRDGLRAEIKGSIALDRVTALHNHGSAGIELWNNAGTGSPGMTLSHVLADHNNWGININARGPVALNHVGASYNIGKGIYIDSGWGTLGMGNVTLSNSLGADLVSFNGGNNLEVHSNGGVSISGLQASGSLTGMGAFIDNAFGAGNVSVVNSMFNWNGNPGSVNAGGLDVTSKGVISLNGVTASDNQGDGAYLANDSASLAGKTVSVSKGTFNGNETGLLIASKSSVTLNNVSANNNLNLGARIYNRVPGPSTGNVTISGTLGRNQFNDNNRDGVVILTNGNISISNSEASSNGSGLGFSGFYIESYGTGKTAVFTCVSATHNTGFGIKLLQKTGTVKATLKGVWLGGNFADGWFYDGALPVTFITYICP